MWWPRDAGAKTCIFFTSINNYYYSRISSVARIASPSSSYRTVLCDYVLWLAEECAAISARRSSSSSSSMIELLVSRFEFEEDAEMMMIRWIGLVLALPQSGKTPKRKQSDSVAYLCGDDMIRVGLPDFATSDSYDE